MLIASLPDAAGQCLSCCPSQIPLHAIASLIPWHYVHLYLGGQLGSGIGVYGVGVCWRSELGWNAPSRYLAMVGRRLGD